MRAIGYASLNTINPQPTQLGLVDQEQLIRDYVRKRGWDLAAMYSEVKNTNSDLNHPQLEKVRKAAVRGEFEVLVIARLDRLTRNIRYLNAVIAELCLKHDVGLVSIEEGLDTLADSGQFAINIIDIFTKWDSKRIPDRTREIIAKKRERGERVGHAPFGYTYQNKKLVEVAEEQRIAELIRKKRDQGLSYHKIARMLNEDSISSKRGGIWYAETVKTVYQNLLSRKKAVNE